LRGVPDAELFAAPRPQRKRGATVCLKGHSLVGNSYATRNGFQCRTCDLEYANQRYEKIRKLREDSRSLDGLNKC
jgi:hypothetical protein